MSEVDQIDDGNHRDGRDIGDALTGDGEAYRRLVERYQAEIARQMRRFSRDPMVQSELTQEVFVDAYLSLRSYRGTAPWLHWLRKIAVRVGYRYWANRQSQRCEITLSEDDWRRLRGNLPEPAQSSDAAELVFALLAQMAPSDRLILTLLYLDGCSMAEVADRTGWSIVGAKVRAFRARKRLRTLLEDGSCEN